MGQEVLIVTRWVRYGHDRLYVKAADGAEIGYRDNKSGVYHVAAGGDGETLRAALATYWAGGGKPAPDAAAAPAGPWPPGSAPVAPPVPPPVAPPPVARPVAPPSVAPPPVARPVAPPPVAQPVTPPPITLLPPEQPWTDLSLTPAGSMARARALATRSEAPVRSLVARIRGVHTDERAWRIGADGEELVAAQLERLGPAWKALHAVPVGGQGSDIDHVLIGPGGVYTINSKHHPGAVVWAGGNTVIVNGAKTWYVRNSRYEARRAAELLSARVGFPVHVTGLIAIISDRTKFTVRSQPPGGDVYVLARWQVADWLSHRGAVLSPAQVGAVFEVARRSTTWTG